LKQQDGETSRTPRARIILHDGIILSKTDFLTKEAIKEIEDFVYDETEWRVCLDLKDCKSEYKPSKKDYVLISNDEDACNYLHSIYGDKIVRTGDDWYCHLPNIKYYSKGEDAVRVLIKKTNVYIWTENGDKPYSASKGGMNSIMEYLTKNCSDLFPINENFLRNVNEKTKGLVFYLDKYYDLKTKNWFAIQTHNLPIVYENRLAPDLSTIIDLDVQAFTKTFLNIFDEKELKVALRALSRTLAGHFEDK
jgi:hypothetical protein